VAHVPPINLFWHPRGSRAYLAQLARFCREHEVGFLDLSDRFWREKDTDALYLYPWDNHMSPRGHAAVAEALSPVVAGWFESVRAQDPDARDQTPAASPGKASREPATEAS
jgi:hypothetical protein